MLMHSVFLSLLLVFYVISDNGTTAYDTGTKTSSVWCSPDKLCSFHNLCYHAESRQFLFVLSAQSILHGINPTELSKLDLSSAHGHNRMFMNLSVVSQVNELLLSAVFRNESLYVIHSFKRDNIMHVIHDDLLPLFSTYLRICGGDIDPCINKYRLTLANDRYIGPYPEWYQLFSKNGLLLLSLSDDNRPVTCYKEVRIGLVRSSLWFDYGFSGVQGRVHNPIISGKDLRLFRDFVLKAMNPVPANRRCVVFIKRTESRRIVNEDFVKDAIIQAMKLLPNKKDVCLVEVDLLKDSSESLVAAVRDADFLVGMHGAGMALAVFLPIGASILEMFPFAIDPYNVSPIMAMCDLDDIGLHYVFWRNLNRSSSIPPSSSDPLGGSISHLPSDQQTKILELEKVDAVPCCHDPAYLFYMFQDTIVSNDFEKAMHNAVKLSEDFYTDDFIFDSYENVKKLWLSPGAVYNIACNFNNDKSVDISWNEPVNSADFDHLDYDVLAMEGDTTVFSGSVRDTKLQAYSTEHIHNLKLWICAKDRASKSKDSFYECRRKVLN